MERVETIGMSARKPRIIPEQQHGIRKSSIAPGAVEAIETLQRAGFSAELVGGCVRDLLAGKRPYDFDVVTSARPEQVRDLFRRCRIIGRRFRLAHVDIGRETLEVSTYRARPTAANARSQRSRVSSKGRILRDNVYGDIEQDAFRRDLTINAMFLRLSDLSIVDYVGGYEDMADKVVRVIGGPDVRFMEDPVRMLRTVRFAAALGFQIEPSAIKAMRPLSHMLSEVPNSRLGDEIAKVVYCGNSADAFALMGEYYLLSRIFPSYARLMRPSRIKHTEAHLSRLFRDTDQRVREGIHVSVPYTLSAVLWLPYSAAAAQAAQSGKTKGPRLIRYLRSLANHVISEQSERTFISLVQQNQIKDIWSLQRSLGAKVDRSVLSEKSFRAALRLFELRADTEDADPELCRQWVELRDQMESSKPRQRRRAPRKGRRSKQ